MMRVVLLSSVIAAAFGLRLPVAAQPKSLQVARSTAVRMDAISDAAALLGLGDPSDAPPPSDNTQKLIKGMVEKNKVVGLLSFMLKIPRLTHESPCFVSHHHLLLRCSS